MTAIQSDSSAKICLVDFPLQTQWRGAGAAPLHAKHSFPISLRQANAPGVSLPARDERRVDDFAPNDSLLKGGPAWAFQNERPCKVEVGYRHRTNRLATQSYRDPSHFRRGQQSPYLPGGHQKKSTQKEVFFPGFWILIPSSVGHPVVINQSV